MCVQCVQCRNVAKHPTVFSNLCRTLLALSLRSPNASAKCTLYTPITHTHKYSAFCQTCSAHAVLYVHLNLPSRCVGILHLWRSARVRSDLVCARVLRVHTHACTGAWRANTHTHAYENVCVCLCNRTAPIPTDAAAAAAAATNEAESFQNCLGIN